MRTFTWPSGTEVSCHPQWRLWSVNTAMWSSYLDLVMIFVSSLAWSSKPCVLRPCWSLPPHPLLLSPSLLFFSHTDLPSVSQIPNSFLPLALSRPPLKWSSICSWHGCFCQLEQHLSHGDSSDGPSQLALPHPKQLLSLTLFYFLPWVIIWNNFV